MLLCCALTSRAAGIAAALLSGETQWVSVRKVVLAVVVAWVARAAVGVAEVAAVAVAVEVAVADRRTAACVVAVDAAMAVRVIRAIVLR